MSNKYEYANEGKHFFVVGSEKIEFPEIKRVVYVHREHQIITIWEGNRKKPVKNARYCASKYFESDLEDELKWSQRRVDEIKDYENKCVEKVKSILENTVIGDVFYASWGFEQTNVDYYQVVAIKGRKFSFRKLKVQADYDHHHMTGKSLPLVDDFYGEETFEKAISKSAVFKKSSFEDLVPLEYELVNGVKEYKAKRFSCYA